MPTPLIKKLADENKVTVQTVEKYWDEAKDILFKQGKKEDDKYFYATVVKIVKNKLGINEMLLSIEEFELACEMAWVHGDVDGNQYDRKHEWDNIKKIANVVDSDLYPDMKLWATMTSYYLSDSNDNYLAHCQYDDTDIKRKKGIKVIHGFSNTKGSYKVLMLLILSKTDKTFILSDVTLSTAAGKYWSKLCSDSNFNTFITTPNGIIEYNNQDAFSFGDDKSKANNRVGIELADTTKSILESIQSRGPDKGDYKDINQLIISRMMPIDE